MRRLQTILTTGPGLRTSQITCTLIKAGMFTSAIRMATTKTSRTDRVSSLLLGNNLPPVSSLLLGNNLPPVSSLLQDSNLPPVSNPLQGSNLPPVSSHALNRVRCKAISSNNWTGHTRTGARGHKTITVHNSISNKTGADLPAQAVGVQEEPGRAVAVAGDGNLKY